MLFHFQRRAPGIGEVMVGVFLLFVLGGCLVVHWMLPASQGNMNPHEMRKSDPTGGDTPEPCRKWAVPNHVAQKSTNNRKPPLIRREAKAGKAVEFSDERNDSAFLRVNHSDVTEDTVVAPPAHMGEPGITVSELEATNDSRIWEPSHLSDDTVVAPPEEPGLPGITLGDLKAMGGSQNADFEPGPDTVVAPPDYPGGPGITLGELEE